MGENMIANVLSSSAKYIFNGTVIALLVQKTRDNKVDDHTRDNWTVIVIENIVRLKDNVNGNSNLFESVIN